jgi:hypothetical protein
MVSWQSTTLGNLSIYFPVTMRAVPTMATLPGNTFAAFPTTSGITAISLGNATTNIGLIGLTVGGGGLTAGASAEVQANSSASTGLIFSADY